MWGPERGGEVRGVTREEGRERDVGGLVAAGGNFLAVALAFLMGVIAVGRRERFLAGVDFLVGLAIVSLAETRSIGAVRYIRLRVHTASGDVVFTTVDPADADRIESVIEAERLARRS